MIRAHCCNPTGGGTLEPPRRVQSSIPVTSSQLCFSSSFLTFHLPIALLRISYVLRSASSFTHRFAVHPSTSGAYLPQRWSPLPAPGRLGPLDHNLPFTSRPPPRLSPPSPIHRPRSRSLGVQGRILFFFRLSSYRIQELARVVRVLVHVCCHCTRTAAPSNSLTGT
jgi:hypothetical protein